MSRSRPIFETNAALKAILIARNEYLEKNPGDGLFISGTSIGHSSSLIICKENGTYKMFEFEDFGTNSEITSEITPQQLTSRLQNFIKIICVMLDASLKIKGMFGIFTSANAQQCTNLEFDLRINVAARMNDENGAVFIPSVAAKIRTYRETLLKDNNTKYLAALDTFLQSQGINPKEEINMKSLTGALSQQMANRRDFTNG